MFSSALLVALLLLFAFAMLLGLTLMFGGTGYEPQHARAKHPPSRHRVSGTGGEISGGRFVG